jgi:hypothetical protein
MLRRQRVVLIAGILAAAATAAAVALAGPPQNASPPTVVGTPTPGSTLSCDYGVWEDYIDGSEPEVAWVVNGTQTTDFGPAEERLFQVTEADLGKQVACRAVAYNIDGSASADSAPVEIVRCTGEEVSARTEAVAVARAERSAASKRVANQRKNLKKLDAAQAKARKLYFQHEQSPAKRKAFLAKQKKARTRAVRDLRAAEQRLKAADQTLRDAQSSLAGCSS